MSDVVQVTIGPVPSKIAASWCRSALELIAAVRAHPHVVAIKARPDMLDLCESLVVIWQGIADRADPFRWSMGVEPRMLQYVAEQWLEIGALSDTELELIGSSWAPEATRWMSDAVAGGVLAALESLGDDGAWLAHRIDASGA